MIDLSGTWSFALDPHGKGEQEKLWNMDFAETVTLPGTTDSNRKGIENTNKSETTYLSRYYKYEGAAWYSRNIEIPADWKEKAYRVVSGTYSSDNRVDRLSGSG